jgi:hypothetical protein
MLCYSYIYDMIFITLNLKSNINYILLKSAPPPPPTPRKNSGCAPAQSCDCEDYDILKCALV